jgi:hypothetical protein
MLQPGRSQIAVLLRSSDFSIDVIHPAALMALGSTRHRTEMSFKNLPGGGGEGGVKAGRHLHRHL